MSARWAVEAEGYDNLGRRFQYADAALLLYRAAVNGDRTVMGDALPDLETPEGTVERWEILDNCTATGRVVGELRKYPRGGAR